MDTLVTGAAAGLLGTVTGIMRSFMLGGAVVR
jgi:biopolymer transport protein ExbB/TolQ